MSDYEYKVKCEFDNMGRATCHFKDKKGKLYRPPKGAISQVRIQDMENQEMIIKTNKKLKPSYEKEDHILKLKKRRRI